MKDHSPSHLIRPPHSEHGVRHVLFTELTAEEAMRVIRAERQGHFDFEEPSNQVEVRNGDPEPDIPETVELFALSTGREGILDTSNFRYISGQAVGLMRLDQSERNAIVAASTGAGKSFVACALAAKYLAADPNAKVLYITRQKPLVNQIKRDASRCLTLGDEEMAILTGDVSPIKRKAIYDGDSRLQFATPQTVNNDVKSGRINLEDYALVIVDEVHKSRGRDAAAEILRRAQKLENKPRVVGFSATPYADEKERDALLTLFGESSSALTKNVIENVDRILINVGRGEKKYVRHDIELPLAIRTPAAILEDGIGDCHDKIVDALVGYPDLQKEAAEFVHIPSEGHLSVVGEHVTTAFVKKVREHIEPDMERSPWRSNLIDHVYTLGAFGRYHQYLTQTGRFFFLDRVGKELAEARLIKIEDEDGRIKPAMFARASEGQNWFYRMLSVNPELGMYKFLLEDTYRQVSRGTEYQFVLDDRQVRTLGQLAMCVDGVEVDEFIRDPDPETTERPRFPTAASMIKHVFQVMQSNLAQHDGFYDHPLTETTMHLLESHLRNRRPGNVLLYSKFYDDAVFLAEHAEHRLRHYGVQSRAVAGGKYMRHRDSREIMEQFSDGEIDFMVGTSFLTEGHHIPGANTLIMKHQPARGDELQQFMGRVGREWKGYIHGLVLPTSEGTFYSNIRKMVKASRLLEHDFRGGEHYLSPS